MSYDKETNKWNITNHTIAEGDDIIKIKDAKGRESSYTFNEGKYGNRICSVRLENSKQTFGVFMLSGDATAGFFVEPAGEPNNKTFNTPLEEGVYDIVKSYGPKWTGWPKQNNDSYKGAACVHYAGNHSRKDGDFALIDKNVPAYKWTTKCMVVCNQYIVSNGIVYYNSMNSFSTAKAVAIYCGAITFTPRTKDNGKNNYYICEGWNSNRNVIRIIKSR